LVETPVACDTQGAIHETLPGAFNFTKYGRNRASIPFGAATFPEGFNIFASEPVKFLNQYSTKIDQTAFAGRPYDCGNGVDSSNGCANLGYCSLNPSMMCILDNTISSSTSLVNQRSCGSANGTCVPLWNSSKLISSPLFKAENILKNLFLKAYVGYSYNFDNGKYRLDLNIYAVASSSASYIPSLSDYGTYCSSSSNHLSPLNDSDYRTYWCGVRPQITNVKIDGRDPASAAIKAGIHLLSFNSIIDPDQQPLKGLVISWGDGSAQTLVNEDSKVDVNNPHKIYHYFSSEIPAANVNIRIKMSDNWDFYCCSRNGDACSALCP